MTHVCEAYKTRWGGGKEFFREGSHFANLDITPRNLQMGTVVKEKKKRLAKKKKFSPSGDR